MDPVSVHRLLPFVLMVITASSLGMNVSCVSAPSSPPVYSLSSSIPRNVNSISNTLSFMSSLPGHPITQKGIHSHPNPESLKIGHSPNSALVHHDAIEESQRESNLNLVENHIHGPSLPGIKGFSAHKLDSPDSKSVGIRSFLPSTSGTSLVSSVSLSIKTVSVPNLGGQWTLPSSLMPHPLITSSLFTSSLPLPPPSLLSSPGGSSPLPLSQPSLTYQPKIMSAPSSLRTKRDIRILGNNHLAQRDGPSSFSPSSRYFPSPDLDDGSMLSHGSGSISSPLSASGSNSFEPYFIANERNVTSPAGGTSYLRCQIMQLGDRTVSWVRQNDLQILTAGNYTYTSDQRFRAIHSSQSNDWTLEIRETTFNDSGVYECQVPSLADTKLSMSVNLRVVELKTSILEGPVLFVKNGNDISLRCSINYVPEEESSSFIFWSRDKRLLNYDTSGRWVVTNERRRVKKTVRRVRPRRGRTSDVFPFRSVNDGMTEVEGDLRLDLSHLRKGHKESMDSSTKINLIEGDRSKKGYSSKKKGHKEGLEGLMNGPGSRESPYGLNQGEEHESSLATESHEPEWEEVEIEEDIILSHLQIRSSDPSDSGNYSCKLHAPTISDKNANPAHIQVHVLNGNENPAAISGASGSGVNIKNFPGWEASHAIASPPCWSMTLFCIIISFALAGVKGIIFIPMICTNWIWSSS